MTTPPRPDPAVVYEQIINPGPQSARATAGVLLHWTASDPGRLRAFGDALEGCPGALPNELLLAHLAAVHQILEPLCPFPIDHMPGNPYAHTHDDV